MTFQGKQILLKENPRKGICSKCGNKKGDWYIDYKGRPRQIQRIQMHHEKYDKSDPLKHTIELCSSCHGKISQQQNRVKMK